MGQAIAQTMRADAKAMVDAKADITPLLGTWINAKRDTDHIAKVEVTERNGAIFARLYGSADELVDWGEVEANPYVFTGTNMVAGFHARYELGTTSVEIAANVKLGILVIQTYTSFQDERLSQFSREFFHLSSAEPADGEVRRGLAFLTGEWVNTNQNTKWIKGFTLTDHGDRFSLRITGAGEPADWGESWINTYLDDAGEPAFHAEYDLGTVEAALAGNTGKSIIIIAAYVRRKDDESANSFCREFFVPR
ncbi:hypothetical protein [Actinophytocola sp.]|uniref:hypothetical protein n=1 Tax=Actinophytocola sp. TaxID=1872138 RepID=UPI002ED14F71